LKNLPIKNSSIKVENFKGRIDKYLAFHLNISRTLAQTFISKGLVKLNNSVVDDSSKEVREGDIITIVEFYDKDQENYNLQIEPKNLKLYEKIELPIIFENDDFICINKWVINVNKVGSNPSIFEYLIVKGYKPYIVHRLDKQTTGCLIVAKNYNSSIKISQLFKERKVKKKYIAIVEGKLEKKLKIEAPIYFTSNPLKKQIVSYGKDAITIVKPIKFYDLKTLNKEIDNTKFSFDFGSSKINWFSLVDIEILTGRTHQIRVHLASINHPILGDLKYGSSFKIVDQETKEERFFLHSSLISFSLDGKFYEFKCPNDWGIKL